jgi:hypothetical protein
MSEFSEDFEAEMGVDTSNWCLPICEMSFGLSTPGNL